MSTSVRQIRKREGSVVTFDSGKIKDAIHKALGATGVDGEELATNLAQQVVNVVDERFGEKIPGVEHIQDVVEEVLMKQGYADVAKAYILYRHQRQEARLLKKSMGVQDDLKLGINAIKVLERRYLLKDDEGNVTESPMGLFRRVARAVASAERSFEPDADVSALQEDFFGLMSRLEFLPNTPTLMNAGTNLGQLSACFVLPVEDSIVGIFESLRDMAVIHQSGGGTGFSFSRLRPQGDIVRSTKGIASGPVSFMKIFDAASGVMKQGGKRRGANMGILNADHPNILEFVEAKTEQNVLSNFNVSVGTSDEFMEAAQKGAKWPLVNPRTGGEARTVDAGHLLDLIVNNAWRTGDPGLIFLDEVNRQNPTPNVGHFEATNPCGELPLLPYESCNLGSINLARMVSGGQVDWDRLRRTVRLAIHFLDNVIEANVFPLAQIERITRNGNRKVGLGVMGLADALVELNVAYNSDEGLGMADSIIAFIAEEARKASVSLAEKRGVFPNFGGSVYDRPEGQRLRNATVLSIAPTGTISVIAGCSSGIEPLFALAYVRNVMEGTRLLETNPAFERVARERGFYSDDLLERVSRRGTVQGIDEVPEDVRRIFVTDWDIEPEWHIKMQAVFQRYVDNSVSKTINLPREAGAEDVRQAYLLAHRLKCKGITVYRYGSKKDQVLTLAGQEPKGTEEAAGYVTAGPEYSGGCPSGACPI
ncbi:MAG: adenosylcobalamin-dependent ribonucleoside-diphosphate reductase [Chloroflexota bacterium]